MGKFCLFLYFMVHCFAAFSLYASTSDEAIAPEQPPIQINFVGSDFFPPLEWLDEDGVPQGFIVDLRRSMSQISGDSVETNLIQWKDAVQAVLEGDADAIALIPSEERQQLLDFTQPFYYVSHGIFVHSDSKTYQSLSDLSGLKVAMVQGAFAMSHSRQFDYNIQVVAAENELECLVFVANKKADACVEITVSSNDLIEENNLDVKASSALFWPQPYVFAVKKGNDQLLERLKNQLAQTFVDGSYHDIYEEWEDRLDWKPQNFWESFQHLSWLMAAFGMLIGLILLTNKFLRKAIADKTYALKQELVNSKILQDQITYNAKHDNSTELLNRRAMFEVLDETIIPQRSSSPVFIIAIHISNFISIISVFGYNKALDIILSIAEKLKVYDSGAASYFGSGVFVASLSSKESVYALIKKLNHFMETDDEVIEPLSIFGITSLESNSEDITSSELISRAIIAMSYAEKHHMNCCEYTKDIEPDSLNLKLLNDYYKVGCKQFELHYQPQLDMKTGIIQHAEALIRWNHPKYGMVPPFKFIPLLEQSGNINDVTRWVITEVIRFIKANPENTKNVTFSINITTRDLVDESFIAFVKNATKELTHNTLIFEMTETELVEEKDKAKKLMKELVSLGINCAVDDYGTGYSSLSYIHQLPIDEIKLDRSLISEIASDDRALKIVHSTIKLAHELGLNVVAEGVEDIEIFDLLSDMNCERIQGYLISRPVPEKEIVELLHLEWLNEKVAVV